MVCEQMFKLKKNGEPNYKCYCRHPELIENYNKAAADTTQTWEVHHRLECCFTQKFLKEMNLYYDVEPEALIFLTSSEHNKIDTKRKRNGEAHKGMRHSEETKRKMSEAAKDRRHSEETRYKMSDSHKGKKLSEEHKKKISEAHKGEKNPFYGKKHSNKTIQKISDNMKIKHIGENNPAYGRHWYNNGKVNKFCYECPEGFILGMLKNN